MIVEYGFIDNANDVDFVKDNYKELAEAVIKSVLEYKREVYGEKEVKEDLSSKTVAELKELAKAKNIAGYTTMKKAELLEALK